MSKKRGKPRLAGPRTPSGRLRPVNDTGTPELLMQRALSINPGLVDTMDNKAFLKAARDTRCTSVLGILYAQHKITGDQHYAGSRYGREARRVMRRIFPVASGGLLVASDGTDVEGIEHEPRTDQDEREERSAHLGARLALQRKGSHIAKLAERVTIYEEPIRDIQLPGLRYALDALAAYYGGVDRLSVQK